jgi:hypothetical protein
MPALNVTRRQINKAMFILDKAFENQLTQKEAGLRKSGAHL